MNKFVIKNLFFALSILPMGFSMDQNGSRDTQQWNTEQQNNRIQKWKDAHGVTTMESLCKEAKEVEVKTGINLGIRYSHKREPMKEIRYNDIREPMEEIRYNDINGYYDLPYHFIKLYFALKELAGSSDNFDYPNSLELDSKMLKTQKMPDKQLYTAGSKLLEEALYPHNNHHGMGDAHKARVRKEGLWPKVLENLYKVNWYTFKLNTNKIAILKDFYQKMKTDGLKALRQAAGKKITFEQSFSDTLDLIENSLRDSFCRENNY